MVRLRGAFLGQPFLVKVSNLIRLRNMKKLNIGKHVSNFFRGFSFLTSVLIRFGFVVHIVKSDQIIHCFTKPYEDVRRCAKLCEVVRSRAESIDSESTDDARNFSNHSGSWKLFELPGFEELSEPTDFTQLITHFHIVQLFELSSSAKPDNSKSSLQHQYFPNHPPSQSFPDRPASRRKPRAQPCSESESLL